MIQTRNGLTPTVRRGRGQRCRDRITETVEGNPGAGILVDTVTGNPGVGILESELSALQIETVVTLCLLILSHSKSEYSMKTNNRICLLILSHSKNEYSMKTNNINW